MNQIHTSQHRRFTVSWIRVLTLFFVFVCCVAAGVLASTLPLEQSLAFLAASITLLALCMGAFLLSNERIVRIIVSLLLASIPIFACLSLFTGNPSGAFAGVALAAACLILFWTINQIPKLILGFLFAFLWGILVLCVLPSIFFERSPFLPKSNFSPFAFFAWIWVGSVLFGCAYFPRRLELRRYFKFHRYPTSRRSNETTNSSKAFTLIELLIGVAIIGIITTGILSGFRYCLQSQKKLQHNAQILEILSSEMNAVLSEAELPAPAPDIQPLPIPLSEFEMEPQIQGGYTVSKTDQPGTVLLTVTLTQAVEPSVSRHLRMVGYRYIGSRKQL
ncbi:MAG: prepilin-type N-terminal cleavage/methylation domain-containing protein [bacterium]